MAFFKNEKDKKGKGKAEVFLRETEETLRRQAARIEELKEENARLSAMAEKLRQREEGVTDALALARRKAREHEEEARIRFALECERLEGYRARWQGYLKDIPSAERLGEAVIATERHLKECASEMRAFIEEDLPVCAPPETDYHAETERLESIAPLPGEEEAVQMSDEELKGLILQLLNKEG